MLALLLSMLTVSVPPKDSTLLYSLKENEVMVKHKEHKLMMTKTGSYYIFCTYRRGVGYFVFSNKTSYGPFTSSEPAHRYEPSYWMVGKADGNYILDALTGKMTGPFAPTDRNSDEQVGFDPFYVRAVITKNNSVNLNGRIHKTRATDVDTLTVTSLTLKYLPGGRVAVSYDLYGYKKSNTTAYYGADSVIMTAPADFSTPKELVEIRAATQESDSLFFKGNFVAVSDRVNHFFDGKGYQVNGNGELFYTRILDDGIAVFQGQKPILKRTDRTYDLYALRGVNMLSFRDDNWDLFYIEADGSHHDESKPTHNGFSDRIVVLKKKRQWAAASDGKIFIGDDTTYPGVDLGYNAVANCYQWLSVHGRSLYINTVYCE